jgi:hypothetical protein
MSSLTFNGSATCVQYSDETIHRGSHLSWPSVPCQLSDESDDEEGSSATTSTITTQSVQRKQRLLGMARKIVICEVPKRSHCAMLIANGCLDGSWRRLFNQVEYLVIEPGVPDTLVDWQDQQRGRGHPLLEAIDVSMAANHVCIDARRVMTKAVFLESRMLTATDNGGFPQPNPEERLTIAWKEFVEQRSHRIGEIPTRMAGESTVVRHNSQEVHFGYGATAVSKRLFFSSSLHRLARLARRSRQGNEDI